MNWLALGGMLSCGAAAAHFACIFGGADWYRFFGAGEHMAQLVERQSIKPTLITLAITVILITWSAYAFSGAGLIGKLPLLRPILVVVTAIYLIRAAAFPIMMHKMRGRSQLFWRISSVIVLMIGLVHAIGLVDAWNSLS